MSLLSDNLSLAKHAIRYLDRLAITSINVPFRVTSFHENKKLSRFDMFLFVNMRAEGKATYDIVHANAKNGILSMKRADLAGATRQQLGGYAVGVTGQIQQQKQTRHAVLEILHGPGSPAEKKKKLKALMEQVKFDPGVGTYTWRARTEYPDEKRIRSVRKAIKFKHGNCGEKSAIAATWLLEETENAKKVFWVNAANWDHAWAVLGDPGRLDAQMVANTPIDKWPESTVIADGWTGDYYPARHHINVFKGGNFPNPFQTHVRRKVYESSKQINVKEDCAWPPKFAPAFRLDLAGDTNKTYERREQELKFVADDMQNLINQMADQLVEDQQAELRKPVKG